MPKTIIYAITTVILLFVSAPALAKTQCGNASWYGPTGNRTASGERYTGAGLTIAHRTLPLGTMVEITANGRQVTARVNDRGPFVAGRIADLSSQVADLLGTKPKGVAPICLRVLRSPSFPVVN